MKAIADSCSSRAQAIQRAGNTLLSFQSRVAQDVYVHDIESQLPRSVYAVGEPWRTNYLSDKDDPETRHPSKRVNDPDGRQGVMKKFTHEHDHGVGLRFYVERGATRGFCAPTSALDIVWPEVLTYLATFTAVIVQCGRRNVVWRPRNLNLWCFPDTKTLVAMPDPREHRVAGRVVLWHGGNLHVTYRGIQG